MQALASQRPGIVPLNNLLMRERTELGDGSVVLFIPVASASEEVLHPNDSFLTPQDREGAS